jgi:hypothetical protein
LSRLGLTALPNLSPAATLNGASAKQHVWCKVQSSPSEEAGGATPVPIFLDRHHDLSGVTAADIVEAHRKDLEVQEQYGVRFLTYAKPVEGLTRVRP